MIPEELADFVASGVSVLVGTRDAAWAPDAVRGMGARVEAAGRELSVFLPCATAGTSLANLTDNGRIAVCFSRAADHRSIQVKGRVVAISPADDEDHRAIDRYRNLLVDSWSFVGVPRRLTLRMAAWPAVTVRFTVDALYEQTPGPVAGTPIALGDAPRNSSGRLETDGEGAP